MAKNFRTLKMKSGMTVDEWRKKQLKDPEARKHYYMALREMKAEIREFEQMFSSQLEALVWDSKFRALMRRWMKYAEAYERQISAARLETVSGKSVPYQWGALNVKKENLRITKKGARDFCRSARLRVRPRVVEFFSAVVL